MVTWNGFNSPAVNFSPMYLAKETICRL